MITATVPTSRELHAIIDRFATLRIVVLGDMVADEYIVGRPVRLSREAPIPVLEYVDRYIVPGGATNLARNVRSLGGSVMVAGVIGDDEPGRHLRRQLEAEEIGHEGLQCEQNRPTSTKTRVVGGSAQVVSQQIARIDRVVNDPISCETQEKIIAYLQQVLPAANGLIVSDYEHGVISRDIIDAALPIARAHNVSIAVDAHGDLDRFVGITVATPNQDEAAASLGRELRDDTDVCQGGRELMSTMNAESIIITRGSEGMTVVTNANECHHIPSYAHSEVRDATGAGDTVSAAVTLSLCAGATAEQAAYIGNIAASIVVRRQGAATAGRLEVEEQINRIVNELHRSTR